MTSKLICPFCGKELVPTSMGDNDTVLYTSVWLPIKNCICNTAASKKIWQALIQSQKDLADMEEQAEFNAIMRGKDDADEIFGLKEQIEICNKREYKLTEQIAILKQDLGIARQALKEYANKDNWGCIEDDRDRVCHTYWYFDGCDDGGWGNAQKALEQIEQKEI